MKLRWLVIVGAALVVAVAAILSVWTLIQYGAGPSRQAGLPIPVQTAPVEFREIEDAIGATAVLQASSQTVITSQVQARIERVFVRQADVVKRGQPLLALNVTDLRDALRIREREVELAERQLELARVPSARPEEIRQAELVRAAAAGDVTGAEAGLERALELNRKRIAVAESKVKLASAPTPPERIAEVRLELQSAERNVVAATLRLKRRQALYSQKLIAGVDVENAEKERQDALTKRDATRQRLALLEKGPLHEAIAVAGAELQAARAQGQRDETAARQVVAQAQAALKIAAEGLRVLRLGPRPEAVAAARAALNTAQAKAAEAAAQLRKTGIDSPVDGVVLQMSAQVGEIAGQTLSERQSLMTIGVIDPIYATARVDETRLQSIRPGQAAVVTVDAYSDRELHGRVEYLEPAIARATRTFQVVISLDNPDLSLRPNLSGFVRIVEHRRALVAPTIAVLGRGETPDRSYVFVAENGRARIQRVRVGSVSGNFTEILDGLQAGQQVVISDLTRLRDGDQIRPRPQTR